MLWGVRAACGICRGRSNRLGWLLFGMSVAWVVAIIIIVPTASIAYMLASAA